MEDNRKPWITIGIPCYQDAPYETLEDYMRFAFHLGRRMPEYEFALGVRGKFEQFRARNAILQAAVGVNSKYCLMLDDDQVIGWKAGNYPSEQYEFLRKLIKHMENDPKLGVVGALYFHRGDECLAVLMKQGNDGGYYYMRDDEITGGLQEVAVTGGGCMLIRMDALNFIPQPWFAPEFKYGTDIQICQKMREAGFKVACDTSLILGHVSQKRTVITPDNRAQTQASTIARDREESQTDPRWVVGSSYHLFYLDGKEYLGVDDEELLRLCDLYMERMVTDFPGRDGDLKGYYESRGKLQVARQLLYHGSPSGYGYDTVLFTFFRNGNNFYGLDYGCGTAPVGFELAMQGNRIDFIDLEGAEGYKFLKWRIEKRSIESRCGFELKGPYDFIMLNDILEHLIDPCAIIRELVPYLKEGGLILTNFFTLQDNLNKEHINLIKEPVRAALLDCGIYPVNVFAWVKKDLGFMDRAKENLTNAETSNSKQDDLL